MYQLDTEVGHSSTDTVLNIYQNRMFQYKFSTKKVYPSLPWVDTGNLAESSLSVTSLDDKDQGSHICLHYRGGCSRTCTDCTS